MKIRINRRLKNKRIKKYAQTIGTIAFLVLIIFIDASELNNKKNIPAIKNSGNKVKANETHDIANEKSVDNKGFVEDIKEMVIGNVAVAEYFTVKRVIDGDTIELDNGKKVRYIGIDTPETVNPRKLVQCYGLEASSKNKALVEGKKIRLEKDITETDKYKRLLRYVYLEDGTFVNLLLVEEGYATSYSYPPDIKYQDDFIRAQDKAKEAGKGLWAENACK